jgi:hypothetical protein
VLTGNWATPETTCAQQNAALTTAGFTAEQLSLGGWDAKCGEMMHGSQFTVQFKQGHLAVFADDSNEWDGEYRIVDDDTFEARDQASAQWYLTYEYSIDRDQLTIDMVRDDFPATTEADLLGEQIAQTVIYETAPFSRRDYTSVAFVVPLTLTLNELLNPVPILDTPNLLTWDAAASDNDKVRFLLPVEVYRPGSSTPEPPPADYLGYLQDQAENGAAFGDVTALTVDGRPATLLTGTTSTSLNGSLGCAIKGGDPGSLLDCFGLQPQFSLRIAVIDMGDNTTLLAWARTDAEVPNEPFLDRFERMLGTIEFE